jgi:hypothetical protein
LRDQEEWDLIILETQSRRDRFEKLREEWEARIREEAGESQTGMRRC